jgi:hypothetical protein
MEQAQGRRSYRANSVFEKCGDQMAGLKNLIGSGNIVTAIHRVQISEDRKN